LYITTVASGCFKSRSGAAHGMRMRSGWRPAWATAGVTRARC
jgi:hypothetical protein